MPRFLACVELSIRRHVAYAYGVLPSVCSLCGGEGPRFLAFAELSVLRHVAYAYGVLPCICSFRGGRGMVFAHGILFGYTSL